MVTRERVPSTPSSPSLPFNLGSFRGGQVKTRASLFLVYMSATEHDSALKKQEILPYVTTWMTLC